jgi:hypothetical protein
VNFRRSLLRACLFPFCFAGLALAQTATAEAPSAAEITRIARQFTTEKLGIWQQRLKLYDWQVAATFVHRQSLPPQTLGGIHWDKTKMTAQIWVLDPADYQLPLQAMLDDMELTIVHELVHLEFASRSQGQAQEGQAGRNSEEREVNDIAEAMLAEDRAKPKADQ